jgi:hypothetical protein
MSQSDHAALVARVTEIVARDKLNLDVERTVAALTDSGESLYFPSTVEVLADKIHALNSRRPDLRVTTDPSVPVRAVHPDRDAFIAWLGKLAPDFDRMLPEKKLSLLNQFNHEKQGLNAPTETDRVTREFQAKYGDNWRQRLTPLERMRLGDTEGSRAVTGKMSHHERASAELASLKARADHGLGPTWEAARLRRIEQLERAGAT